MIKAFISRNKKAILFGTAGTVAGALAGFLYWKYVGCISGTCAIWTNPVRATLYGALLGALILLTIAPGPPKKENS